MRNVKITRTRLTPGTKDGFIKFCAIATFNDGEKAVIGNDTVFTDIRDTPFPERETTLTFDEVKALHALVIAHEKENK